MEGRRSPREAGQQPQPYIRHGEAESLRCLYNPLTLSLLAVVISILAIIVAARKKNIEPSSPSHG
jgi:hypothetical protein